jgi:hypothetical protein
MEGSTIALLLLLPAAAVFVYAGWREYRRYRSEGPSNYGLTYDPETNTTHVGPLPEGEESYDPDEFEPVNEAPPDEDTPESEADDDETADETADDTEEDRRT